MTADENRTALDANRRRVDAVAEDWRQGDVFRSDDLAPHIVVDLDLPLTEASLAAARGNAANTDARVVSIWHEDEELVLISQDCDIVETSARAQYVAVSPVVVVEPEIATQAARGYMPGLAPIPELGVDRFADLSRIVTAEKSLLLGATRVARLRDDDELRMFRGIVHRHFSRAAFPEELQRSLAGFVKTLRTKKEKDSIEGRAIHAIDEIRVKCFPSWAADEVDVTVYLLCSREGYTTILTDDDREAGRADVGASWLEVREKWQRQCDEGRLAAGGNIRSIEISIELFEQMTAADYVDSDPLDLRGMSPQGA